MQITRDNKYVIRCPLCMQQVAEFYLSMLWLLYICVGREGGLSWIISWTVCNFGLLPNQCYCVGIHRLNESAVNLLDSAVSQWLAFGSKMDAEPEIDPNFEPQTRVRSNTWPCKPRDPLSDTQCSPASDECTSENAIKQENIGLNKKTSSRRNAWGNLSYADLITKAIQSSTEQRLTLSQIYDWMVQNVPYFKDKGDNTSSAGWKVSKKEYKAGIVMCCVSLHTVWADRICCSCRVCVLYTVHIDLFW